jgi:hypothetical protein
MAGDTSVLCEINPAHNSFVEFIKRELAKSWIDCGDCQAAAGVIWRRPGISFEPGGGLDSEAVIGGGVFFMNPARP